MTDPSTGGLTRAQESRHESRPRRPQGAYLPPATRYIRSRGRRRNPTNSFQWTAIEASIPVDASGLTGTNGQRTSSYIAVGSTTIAKTTSPTSCDTMPGVTAAGSGRRPVLTSNTPVTPAINPRNRTGVTDGGPGRQHPQGPCERVVDQVGKLCAHDDHSGYPVRWLG